MKIASFDLETIADKSSLKFLPEPTAKKSLRDPVKIEKDIAEKREKQISEAGLNPATAKICCFGWAWKSEQTTISVKPQVESNHLILKDENPQSEKKLLQDAWEVLAGFDHYTTFNGYGFDVPVLLMRSAIHRVRPSVNISTKKYNISNHTDSRMVLGNWDNFARGGLDFYCKLLLGESVKGEFSGNVMQEMFDLEMFYEIGEYCMKDAIMTYKLYEVVANYYLL